MGLNGQTGNDFVSHQAAKPNMAKPRVQAITQTETGSLADYTRSLVIAVIWKPPDFLPDLWVGWSHRMFLWARDVLHTFIMFVVDTRKKGKLKALWCAVRNTEPEELLSPQSIKIHHNIRQTSIL